MRGVVLRGAWVIVVASCGGQVESVGSGPNAADSASPPGATDSSSNGSESGGATSTSSGTADPSCPLPWWGTPLDGPGLLSCPEPYDPALLAYTFTIYPDCEKVTGPIATEQHGDRLSCCYHFDERPCDNDWQSDGCIDIPYFGSGQGATAIPATPVSFDACQSASTTSFVPSTDAERASAVIGVWLLCSKEWQFQGRALELSADGSFQTLTTDSEGRLVPTHACHEHGLWGFIVDPPDQLDLYTDQGMSPWHVLVYAPDHLTISVDVNQMQFVRVE